jgi:hypothetical protein
MKIAIILTMHQSKEIRPNGFELVDRYLTSLKKSVDPHWQYTVFLFDNTSEDKFNLDKYNDMDIRYTYVEDQTLTGVTGPWNDGALNAFNDGYDKIFISNDDLIFNKSINYLFEHTVTDNVIYGPLCQPGGMLGNSPQISNKAHHNIIDITGKGEVDEMPTEGYLLNGFLFGFTNKFYEKYQREDGYIFNSSKKYIWSANECEIQLRLWKEGVKSHLVGLCWIYHEKIRAWKYHFGQRVAENEYNDLSKKKNLDYEQNWKSLMEYGDTYENN